MCAYPFHQMDETPRSNPIPNLIVICVLVAGGVYFAQHYKVAGLDHLSIESKSVPKSDDSGALDELMFVSASESSRAYQAPDSFVADREQQSVKFKPLRIGSWALSGFGPSKLADAQVRLNLVKIIREFDAIALQQINAAERDLIPRLVDEINEGGREFDYAMGRPCGPVEQPEHLAILFNINRLRIDRSQTYTVADPVNRMTYDPLVAWFQAAEPSSEAAWTFSFVNVRINLERAPIEVALLPGILSSVRLDGRGEDDVVMAGIFQADDAYLIPRVMGNDAVAAVRSTTTDIFNRHQTCNVVVDGQRTSEFIGRGGPVDFLRVFNLNLSEAEAISSHLPVFGEFTVNEGGNL